MKRVLKVTAKRNDLLLPVKGYKMMKENVEPKLSEQEVTVKAMVLVVKQQKRRCACYRTKVGYHGKSM